MKRIIGATILGAGIAIVSTYPFCVLFFLSGSLQDGQELGLALAGAAGYSLLATLAASPLSSLAGLAIGLGIGISSHFLQGRPSLVGLIALVIGAVVGVFVEMFLRSLAIPFGDAVLDLLPAYAGVIAAVAAYSFDKVAPYWSGRVKHTGAARGEQAD